LNRISFYGILVVLSLLLGCPAPSVVEVEEKKPTEIALDKSLVFLANGEEVSVTATVSPQDADNKDIVWSSSNSDVATVDSNGKINALDEGKVTITAKSEADKTVLNTMEVEVVEKVTSTTIRTIDSSVWLRKSISYSGYRVGQDPRESIYPSEDEIKEDLELLISQGFGLIRLYDTTLHAERTLKVIEVNSFDIKVQLGIYVTGKLSSSSNYGLLDDAVELVNNYKDIIVSVSVGNETLVSWSFVSVAPADIIQYVRYIRSKIELPVTINDDNNAFADKSGSLWNANRNVWKEIDYASVHSYAYWDATYGLWDIKFLETPEDERNKAMMDYAINYAKTDFEGVRKGFDSLGLTYLPIVIGETGWQNEPTGRAKNPPSSAVPNAANYMADQLNQAAYYDGMMKWAFGENLDDPGDGITRPASMFYFSAFNEPWKSADDHWGLWDENRDPRYVLTREGLDPEDAVYYIDPDAQDPPEPGLTITDADLIVFRDTAKGEGEEMPEVEWNSWEGNTTATISTVEVSSPEGTTHGKIIPEPESWGWGMTIIPKQPVTATEPPVFLDLSSFTTTGKISFKIKTTYSSPIEIGFSTGHGNTRDSVDVYIKVDPANNSYGYKNDGNWNSVVIPISNLAPLAKASYGSDSASVLDMTRVLSLFVVADRFETTGNTGGTTADIEIDDISWILE
jgi:exo-beta-1,3-glucanase (GH17 family)